MIVEYCNKTKLYYVDDGSYMMYQSLLELKCNLSDMYDELIFNGVKI